MHPETSLALHRIRAADLRTEADTHRRARAARHRYGLRARLGWTLVEVGLRLASSAPRTAPALA
ncbi:hypothetical protein [Streptomyces sp. KL116D]|uniref:hypothetical protein n=1 Tax=Streptomyces sp. KL116D TaxID=3045152 RepID=UPI0035578E36